MIKIIFLADIVGKVGRRAVQQYLPKLKRQYHPDLVIANAENLAHGVGFTRSTLAEMSAAGVDFFTSGNHAWKKANSDEILDERNALVIRPANYMEKKSGRGFKLLKIGQNKIIVVNLLGRVFIPEKLDCPFRVMEKILARHPKAVAIVDFHGEATSEKVAFGQYFAGQVAAVIGTHTHVPTADERIIAPGTAFITDAGMIGLADSVIGADKRTIWQMFLGHGKSSGKHDLPDSGPCEFDAVYLEIDEKSSQAKKIKRLNKIIEVK